MQKYDVSRGNVKARRLWLFLALPALESLICAAVLLAQRSDSASGVLLGYSAARLAVVIAVLAAAGLAASATFVIRANGKHFHGLLTWLTVARNRSAVLIGLFLLTGLAWVGSFLPAGQAGPIGSYLENLRPAFWLAVLGGLQSILFVLIGDKPISSVNPRTWITDHRVGLLIWSVIMAGFAATWALIAVTGLGVMRKGEDYWFGAGVPVLAWAVLGACIAAGLAVALERRRPPARIDLILFFSIWIVGALAWMMTPAPNGWFNPGPFPPNYETYPFSDAAKYDIQAQFALIGQGLNNGGIGSRPAYPAFLVLIHALTGQDYDSNMNLQAAIFAVFPAIAFLLGSRLLNRAAGVTAAVLLLLRGMTAIAATSLLDLANAKQMLPDFPAAIGIAACLLLCARWFHQPDRLHHALLTGGAMALAVYLRPTALGILPVLMLLAVFVYWKRSPRRVAAALALLIAGYAAFSFAWEARAQVVTDFGAGPTTLRKVLSVLSHRFGLGAQVGEEWPPAVPPPTEEAVPPEEGAVSTEVEDVPRQPSSRRRDNDGGQGELDLAVIANHWLHNITASVLSLPTSFSLADLKGTVGAQVSPWKGSWRGQLSVGQAAILILNLALFALGLSSALRSDAVVGALPAAAFFSYHLANAFGRTSGGRYVVPVDWIVVLYFGLGLTAAAAWLLQVTGLLPRASSRPRRAAADSASATTGPPGLLRTAAALLLAGTLLVIPDFAFPRLLDPTTTLSLEAPIGDLDQPYVNALLADDGLLYSGKILYPHTSAGNANGEFFFENTRTKIPYPVVGFSVVGTAGLQYTRIPGYFQGRLPNYSDAIVLGCRQHGLVEAVLVIVTGPEPMTLVRDPLPAPQCRLPEPDCESYGSCR